MKLSGDIFDLSGNLFFGCWSNYESRVKELKQFCIIPVEGSREKESVELNEYQMWMMKLVITGKTMTPKGKKVLWNYSVVLCESVENNPMVNELEYGLESHCSIERTQQTTDKHDNKTEVLRKRTTKDGKLKRSLVKLAPLFYESVFRAKNRAGNVGASHQQAKKLVSEHAV